MHASTKLVCGMAKFTDKFEHTCEPKKFHINVNLFLAELVTYFVHMHAAR